MSFSSCLPLISIRLVWRITIGLSLIPAFGTLYQRLTLPESTRFERSRKVGAQEEANGKDDIAVLKAQAEKDVNNADSSMKGHTIAREASVETQTTDSASDKKAAATAAKKNHFRGEHALSRNPSSRI